MNGLWYRLLPLLTALTVTAQAQITRYAVVAGNDVGTTDEAPLRYAQADARKVFEVLRELGDFQPENMVLLEGQTAKDLSRVLISVNARIRAETLGGRDSVLFVYYSGHADSEALHAGAEPLELGLLQRLVQGSPAGLRVLVLDACRSGSLTRVKGARKTNPFPVQLGAELRGEGLALLTSSASDEDSQESDALQGSFFTHYFVSGLRGAADHNGDGRVSVEEAYEHAYEHTLRASSRSWHGTQHPTFRFDLEGKGAVPLTWLSPDPGRGARLLLPPGRAYLIFSKNEHGPVIAEVAEHDAQRWLTLEPGTYFVRGRAKAHLLEGSLELGPGQARRLVESELSAVEYAHLARKGGTERTYAHGPWVGYQVRTPLWSQATPCQGVRLGYALDLPALSLRAGAGGCRSSFANETLRAQADDLSGDLSASHAWDFSAFSLSFGTTVGGSWLRERFETAGRAPGRDSLAVSIGAQFGVSLGLGRGYHLFSEAIGQALVFREHRDNDSAETVARPSLRITLGSGRHF